MAYALAAIYGLASLLAFAAYALDKFAAQRGKRRIPEARLHLLALLWGWPGAWAGQILLRHKTQKRGFQALFWATVILNLALTATACWWIARR